MMVLSSTSCYILTVGCSAFLAGAVFLTVAAATIFVIELKDYLKKYKEEKKGKKLEAKKSVFYIQNLKLAENDILSQSFDSL
jgi:hypothetical protein